jgi:peptidoglycan hydrolase-like protein with peptidoglycan-binding domain
MQAKVAQQGGKENAAKSQARLQLPAAADHSARPSGIAATLLNLQRTHGNRYVQRMLSVARSASGNAVAGPGLSDAIHCARGGGQALDPSVRAEMEPVFGSDFSGVRVHTDAKADTLNRAVSARAFTIGQDIFFRQGVYRPVSRSGRALLAHELTHVVQQAGNTVQRELAIGEPDDQYEKEADRMAEAVLSMSETHVAEGAAIASPSSQIQRKCSTCEEEIQRQPEEETEDKEPSQTGMMPGTAGKGSPGLTGYVIRRMTIGRGKPTGLSSQVSKIQRLVIQRQPTVSRGSTGCPVPELQEALNATGEALTVDGSFGNGTDAAVKRFQTAHPPLPSNGVVDAATWTAIHTAAPGDYGLPSGETTTSNGWATGANATIHRWKQRLTPTTTNFRNCSVREADPGGGTDTCHFAGSAYAPFTGVTGGTWPVGARNAWGDDFVGWFTNAVTYYRTNGRAPCTASFPQSMRVVRPAGDVHYRRNQLTMTIGTTTVDSTRDGQTQSKTWP